MMNTPGRRIVAGWLLSLSLLVCTTASAQVPHHIRYQGQALDNDRVPLSDGAYTLTFRLYDAPESGKKLWEETHPKVALINGYFSVLLGSVQPMTTIDWNHPCWVSVQVNGDKELATRQFVTSVPMAILAEGLGDMSARVYNSNGISIPDDTEIRLPFDSEEWDPQNMHSPSVNPSRLTAPAAGKYFIYGSVGFDASGVGVEMITLFVNHSGAIAAQSFTDTSNTFQTKLQVATYYELAAGDYVELAVFQKVGGALSVYRQGGLSPEFGMTKVE